VGEPRSWGEPHQWLEKAERFLGTGRLALRHRDYESAVSRAYYAVLGALNAVVPQLADVDSHRGSLQQAARWNRRYTGLRAAGVLRGRRDLHGSLERLWEWRNLADYELAKTSRERALEALGFAERVVMAAKEWQQ